jgi:hypothetical protein
MVTIPNLPASRHRVPASQKALNGNHPCPEWWRLEPASFVAGNASFVEGNASFVEGYAAFVAGYAAGV